ncbi:putative carboxylesterase [Abeliophyllum distichum]|uniref:Carboxylesterase n=1 Tax=Abeliophyllum distichum TaxID=126358 RepID=A0ABD1V941_9LAMI
MVGNMVGKKVLNIGGKWLRTWRSKAVISWFYGLLGSGIMDGIRVRLDGYFLAVRTETLPGDVKILGRFLSYPYFWGSKPIESETKEKMEQNVAYKIWLFVYPSIPGGIDNPMINPFVDDVSSLSRLACLGLLVCLVEKDPLTSSGILYVESVKKSGWNREVELVGVEGEDHCFHFFDPD